MGNWRLPDFRSVDFDDGEGRIVAAFIQGAWRSEALNLLPQSATQQNKRPSRPSAGIQGSTARAGPDLFAGVPDLQWLFFLPI